MFALMQKERDHKITPNVLISQIATTGSVLFADNRRFCQPPPVRPVALPEPSQTGHISPL